VYVIFIQEVGDNKKRWRGLVTLLWSVQGHLTMSLKGNGEGGI